MVLIVIETGSTRPFHQIFTPPQNKYLEPWKLFRFQSWRSANAASIFSVNLMFIIIPSTGKGSSKNGSFLLSQPPKQVQQIQPPTFRISDQYPMAAGHALPCCHNVGLDVGWVVQFNLQLHLGVPNVDVLKYHGWFIGQILNVTSKIEFLGFHFNHPYGQSHERGISKGWY